LFAALLHDPQTAAIKAELKWLTGELGPARELDVLVHRVVALMKRRRRIWRGMSSTLRTTSFNTTYEAWIYRAIISLAWPLQRRRFAVRRDRLFDWPHVGKLPASLQPRRPDVCALDLIRQTGPAVEMRHESPQPLQARSSPQIGSQGAS
jgi:hypothetical protein